MRYKVGDRVALRMGGDEYRFQIQSVTQPLEGPAQYGLVLELDEIELIAADCSAP